MLAQILLGLYGTLAIFQVFFLILAPLPVFVPHVIDQWLGAMYAHAFFPDAKVTCILS
jgi:hypothetical protein